MNVNRWKYLAPQFEYLKRKYADKELSNYYEVPFSDGSFMIDKFFQYMEDCGYIIKEINILSQFIIYKPEANHEN